MSLSEGSRQDVRCRPVDGRQGVKCLSSNRDQHSGNGRMVLLSWFRDVMVEFGRASELCHHLLHAVYKLGDLQAGQWQRNN